MSSATNDYIISVAYVTKTGELKMVPQQRRHQAPLRGVMR